MSIQPPPPYQEIAPPPPYLKRHSPYCPMPVALEILSEQPLDPMPKYSAKKYNEMIKNAGKSFQFSNATEAFRIAVANQPFNPMHYNYYLDAAIRNDEFEIARQTFDRTIELKIANPCTYDLKNKLDAESPARPS